MTLIIIGLVIAIAGVLMCFVPAFQIGQQVQVNCQVESSMFGASVQGKCVFTNTGWTPGSTCAMAKLVNHDGGEANSAPVCSGRIWPNDTTEKDVSILLGHVCDSDDEPWTKVCKMTVVEYHVPSPLREMLGLNSPRPAPESQPTAQDQSRQPSSVNDPSNAATTVNDSSNATKQSDGSTEEARPADVAALISRESSLDDICRGSVDPATTPGWDLACATRSFAYDDILKKGWCWGPDDASDEAHKRWLPCPDAAKKRDPVLVQLTGVSFDCTKASKPDEILICGDHELSLIDGAIAGYYKEAKNLFQSSPDKLAELLQTQRQFLSVRAQCGNDKTCIEKVTARRMNALQDCDATICDLEDEFKN